MNKRSIAVAVAKHPIIKKLLEARLVESSIISRLIVEEITSDLEEALTPEQTKVISNVRNYLSKLNKADDNTWKKALQDAESRKLGIYGFEDLSDELKKFALQKFYNAKRTKAAKARLGSSASTGEPAGEPAAGESTELSDQQKEKIEKRLIPLVKKFVDMLFTNKLLQERLEFKNLINDLGVKDKKAFGRTLGKTFNPDEIEQLSAIFNNEKISARFIDMVKKGVEKRKKDEPTTAKPEAGAGEEKKEPETGAGEEKKEPELVSLNKDNLDTFIEVFGEFRDNFKRVQYLDEQAGLLLKLLGIVKTISGKGLSDLDKRRRAYTRTLTTEAPERGQRDIIVTSGVVLRHMDTLEDVLQIYKRQSDAGTVGSNEMFRKYGDGNPRKYLTFLLNKVVIKDLNSLLNSLSTAIKRKEAPKPDTSSKPITEQEEDDVEAIIDAVTKAYQDAVVEGEKLVLLLTKKATKPEVPAEPAGEPTGEPAGEDAEEKLTEEEGERREEQPLEASIIAATGRIYDILQPITKYFSQVNPFGTDMGHDEVLKDFRSVVKGLVLLVGQINEYAKDGDITVALARAAQTKLQAIKNFLLKTFGLTDSAKKAGETGALNDVGDGEGFVESGDVADLSSSTFNLDAEEGADAGAGEKAADPAETEEAFEQTQHVDLMRFLSTKYITPPKFKSFFGSDLTDEQLSNYYKALMLFLSLAYFQKSGEPEPEPIEEQILKEVVVGTIAGDYVRGLDGIDLDKDRAMAALIQIQRAEGRETPIFNTLVTIANRHRKSLKTMSKFLAGQTPPSVQKLDKQPTVFIKKFLETSPAGVFTPDLDPSPDAGGPGEGESGRRSKDDPAPEKAQDPEEIVRSEKEKKKAVEKVVSAFLAYEYPDKADAEESFEELTKRFSREENQRAVNTVAGVINKVKKETGTESTAEAVGTLTNKSPEELEDYFSKAENQAIEPGGVRVSPSREKIEAVVDDVIDDENVDLDNISNDMKFNLAGQVVDQIVGDKDASEKAKIAIKRLAIDVINDMLGDIQDKAPNPRKMSLTDFEETLNTQFVQAYFANADKIDGIADQGDQITEDQFNFLKDILLQTIQENEEKGDDFIGVFGFHALKDILNLPYETVKKTRNLRALAEELEQLRTFKRIKSAVDRRDLDQARALLDDIDSKDTYDDEGNLVPKDADEPADQIKSGFEFNSEGEDFIEQDFKGYVSKQFDMDPEEINSEDEELIYSEEYYLDYADELHSEFEEEESEYLQYISVDDDQAYNIDDISKEEFKDEVVDVLKGNEQPKLLNGIRDHIENSKTSRDKEFVINFIKMDYKKHYNRNNDAENEYTDERLYASGERVKILRYLEDEYKKLTGEDLDITRLEEQIQRIVERILNG